MISTEDHKVLSENLRKLHQILLEHGHHLLIHPDTLADIERDPDPARREIILSKAKAYPQLESPPEPSNDFLSRIGPQRKPSDRVDDAILFSIHKNFTDILITEDKGIHRKASEVELEDRVFSVESALEYFDRLYARIVPRHTLLKEDFVRSLDLDDTFFDSLRGDYGDFNVWCERISIAGRKCWVYTEEGKIRALLIIKEECEPIFASPPLDEARRLKICTLKVDMPGFKIGELLLKIAFEYCLNNDIPETYLTHYRKDDNGLISLIEEFGFVKVSVKKTGEEVFLKGFMPAEAELHAITLAKKYYPSFKDSPEIRKFVVPIKPEYHDRLFPDYQTRQMKITEYFEINIPGNTIRKAYLSHSKIRKIRPGDILIFYRSEDQKQVTILGVVEKTLHTRSEEEILRTVGKRTVYSYDEIRDFTKKSTLVILFRHHFNLPSPLKMDALVREGILSSAPQSIVGISHKKYQRLKHRGGLDERFIVS